MENKNKRKNVLIIVCVIILLVLVFVCIKCFKKNNTDEEGKKLVFTLSSTMLKCNSPTLYVYDDKSYEYYYTFSTNDKELVPKKGTYDYDVKLILDNLNTQEVDGYYVYKLVDSNNQTYNLGEYQPISDFLQLINIDIHTCLSAQE